MAPSLRCLAFVWVLLSSSTAVAAEARAGAIRLSPPEGWARSEHDGAVVFSAPGLPDGEGAFLAVLPTDTAADWPAPFDRAWEATKAEYRDVEEVAPTDGSHHGYQFRYAAGSMVEPSGRVLYVLFFSARNDEASQPLMFVATDAKVYERLSDVLEQTLESVRFVGRAAPARGAKPGVSEQRSGSPAPAARSEPARGGVARELVGTWSVGSVSPVGFYNPTTGQWAAPSGSGQNYELRADGTFVYSGLLQTGMYGCTTSVFLYNTGVWKAEGGTLVLRGKTANIRSTDNCNKKFNYAKKQSPKTESFPWRLQPDDSGAPQLVLTTEHGDIEFRRR